MGNASPSKSDFNIFGPSSKPSSDFPPVPDTLSSDENQLKEWLMSTITGCNHFALLCIRVFFHDGTCNGQPNLVMVSMVRFSLNSIVLKMLFWLQVCNFFCKLKQRLLAL